MRAPANIPRGHWELYEGIIETDRWFGPLLSNMRLTKTDVQVRLEPDWPIFQVVPLPRTLYGNETLQAVDLRLRLADLGEAEWAAFEETVVKPCSDPQREQGAYAQRTRRRRRTEATHGAIHAVTGEEERSGA